MAHVEIALGLVAVSADDVTRSARADRSPLGLRLRPYRIRIPASRLPRRGRGQDAEPYLPRQEKFDDAIGRSKFRDAVAGWVISVQSRAAGCRQVAFIGRLVRSA